MVFDFGISIALVAAVVASVSAFNDGSDIFSRWQRRREEKKVQAARDERELEIALAGSPKHVEREHEKFSAAMNPNFACADGDAGKAVLRSIEKFNRTVVNTLRLAVNGGSAYTLNLEHLLSVTDSLRKDTVPSMTQLFQRLWTARGVPQSLAAHVQPLNTNIPVNAPLSARVVTLRLSRPPSISNHIYHRIFLHISL
ncbi:hypothetical protein AOQ84DRAFT_393455 [Glonium stellatum]|uniref:Uncharacterized protein n=1 Tax=Glonium stellatum TaxID=574774 RepID=A0A8E2EN28_9PEZI|nr:hypothetical protein AOQ84DRAFT_393455 [Glonium stellatum]